LEIGQVLLCTKFPLYTLILYLLRVIVNKKRSTKFAKPKNIQNLGDNLVTNYLIT